MYLNNTNVFSIPIVADEEFDELCFEFGLELDEIVSHIKLPLLLTSMLFYTYVGVL